MNLWLVFNQETKLYEHLFDDRKPNFRSNNIEMVGIIIKKDIFINFVIEGLLDCNPNIKNNKYKKNNLIKYIDSNMILS